MLSVACPDLDLAELEGLAPLRAGPPTSASYADLALAAAGPRRQQLRQQQAAPSLMRKSMSTPSLTALGTPEGEGLEVYVVMRSFTEFGGGLFRKLPAPVRHGVRDSGICHYMTVFKQPDGSLVQFDFGPKGGDIHVARGPFARLLSKQPLPGRSKVALGEVRENQLTQLPSAHMYVGRTNLSIDDIRAWNSLHKREYELHINDCRHFVNSLVKYTTGMESAASSCLRHQWVANRDKYGLANRIVRLGQIITDLSNWQRVKAVSQASFATVMALATHGTLSRLAAVPIIQTVRRSLVPVARRQLLPVKAGVVKAVVQKPVYAMGTAAVATCAAAGGPAPLARDALSTVSRITGGVKTAVRAAGLAAATVAETVSKTMAARATASSRGPANQVVAIASGVAGVATRGAAGALSAKRTTTTGGVRAGPGSPLRITLPSLNSERAQRLALVATRR